jgi:hypothetical protein
MVAVGTSPWLSLGGLVTSSSLGASDSSCGEGNQSSVNRY